MADGIVIDYGLDPSDYIAGVSQITSANSQLQQSFGGLTSTTSLLQRAMDVVTPKRAAIAGWSAMASAAAAQEQALSGLSATSAITGINTEKLTGSINQLARTLPMGASASRQTVMQFTQMGVASAGSEPKIAKLSKTVLELSGATGEGPAQLAQGMTDLARASGNTQLDPKRFASVADSLTTVSKESGASAGNILAFSKNIAPMAQAAGIGTTGILGISSAFARLGEDGVGASTAVNKMLSDMSRAARDGTPEMATYAQIVGKTSDEFERLFKANPTEALTQVTEAISKAGPAGPRQLEMLGLDGVRTQRSLQALSASGGLREAVATATAGYGSGSTQKASEAAFKGLNDSVNLLQENSRQLAVAFGEPLLAPLTAFTKALTVPTSLLRAVVSSTPVQKGLEYGAMAGGAMMLGKGLLGPIGTFALGRQALTSGVVTSLAGGWAAGRGVEGQDNRLSRFGAPSIANDASGNWPGPLGGVSRRLFNFTRGVSESREAGIQAAMSPEAYARRVSGLQGGPGGTSLIRRIGVGAAAWGSTVAQTYGNTVREQMDNSRQRDPNLRTSSMGTPAYVRSAFENARQSYNAAGGLGTGLGSLTSSMSQFNKELIDGAKAGGTFRSALTANANAVLATARAGSSMAFAGGGTALKGAGGLAARGGRALMGGFGGPVGLSLLGAGALFSAWQNHKDATAQHATDFMNSDISGTENAYRESVGAATGPTQTFGSQAEQLQQNLVAGAQSRRGAARVTDADVTTAMGSRGKVTHTYQGSNREIAAQIRQVNPAGLDTSELQAIKVDLLRQNGGDKQKTNQIMAMALSGGVARPGRAETGSGANDLAASITAAGNAPDKGGLSGVLQKLMIQNKSMYAVNAGGAFAPGGFLYRGTLSDATRGQITSTVEANSKRRSDQAESYGVNYALQEQIAGAGSTLKAVQKTGDGEAYMETANQLTAAISGHKGGYKMTPADLAKYHGNVGAFLADKDSSFKKTYENMTAEQKKDGGTISPELLQSAVSKNLSSVSPFFSKAFDARSNSSLSQAVAASVSKPGDVGKLDQAATSFVKAAGDAGMSMSDLGSNATKAANNLDEASAEFAVVKAAQAKAERAMSANEQNMAPSQAMSEQYAYLTKQATQVAKNPTQQAEKSAAQDSLAGLDQQNRGRLTARLTEQRQYEVNVTRSTQDYQTQRSQSIQDFNIQVQRAEQSSYITRTRTLQDYHKTVARSTQDYQIARSHEIRDFNINIARTEQDYTKTRMRTQRDFNTSMERSEQDYQTSRERTVRDFNITMSRGEQDFNKARLRSIQDYNLQVKRAVEDSAKSLYDPYARIQTQATWDAKNLLVNLAEQNAAIAKQKTQLDQVRKMGLSAAAIDQLGLGKAENAQQLNQLVGDLGSNHSLVARFNQTAAQRGTGAGALYKDSSNTDAKRQEQDFKRGLSRQEEDQRQSVARSHADLNRQMSDQAADFRKSAMRSRADLKKQLNDMAVDMSTTLARARADLSKTLADQAEEFGRTLARGAEDLDTNLTRTADDTNRALRQMEDDSQRSLDRQAKAFNLSLKRAAKDLHDSDLTMAGDLQTLTEETNRALHGQSVHWQKLMVNDSQGLVDQLSSKVLPNYRKVMREMGVDPASMEVKANAGGAQASAKHADIAASRAEGGPIPGFSPHPKADNVLIRATAGEFMQPVAAVQHYGSDAMEAIRTMRVPKEVLQAFASGGMVASDASLKGLPARVMELIRFGRQLQTQGYQIGENAAFGPVHPVHMAGSYHYKFHDHGALDVNYDGRGQATEDKMLDRAVAEARAHNFAITWHAPGHFDHAHFDVGPWSNVGGNITKVADGGGGGASALAAMGIDVDKVFAGVNVSKGGLDAKMLAAAKKAAAAAWGSMGGGSGGGVSAYNGNGGAAQWRGDVNQVLRMLGQPLSLAGAILRRIDFESSGNPQAVNSNDVNSISWRNGGFDNRSKGLMQTVPGTFEAYRSSKLADNIYDPKANIYAGANYALHRYGSIAAVDPKTRPMGYDAGGWMKPGDGSYRNETGKPEPVLTHEQWGGISKLAEKAGVLITREEGKALSAANSVHMTVHHNEQITYDSRNDFGDANITVVSNDPDDMARKLERKAVLGRVSQTRGVRR